VIVVDGTAVTCRLRDAGIHAPVLMLATKSTPAEVVKSLDAGADDCLTKPFSSEVLLARLRSVSRRGAVLRPSMLECSGLVADLTNRKVTRAGNLINLTQREYRLLEVLLLNAGRVVTRESILKSVWGLNAKVTSNSLDAFIRLLRVKIDAGRPKLIHTVRGIGYIMKESS
jgi:two-component system response regulator MprA